MKRLILDHDAEIEINGHVFLLEAGDSILIEESIEDKKRKLQHLSMYVKKATNQLEDIEEKLSIRYDQELDDRRNKLKKLIALANDRINGLKAELSGMDRKELARLAAEISAQQKQIKTPEIATVVDTPEKDVEDKIKSIDLKINAIEQEIDDLQDMIADKERSIEKASAANDRETLSGLRHELNKIERQRSNYEDDLSRLRKIRDQYEEMKSIERAVEYEEELEETDDREELGITIKSAEQLEKMPSEEEEYFGYTSEVDVALGDQLSQELINIEFQPSQLGLYSDMLESQASA